MKITHLVLILIATAFAAGCSSSTALEAWEQSVETYVMEQANGDVTALRATGDGQGRPHFGLIGAKRGGIPLIAPVRTDVNAVLLAHRQIAGSPWFVFLAGEVKYDNSFDVIPLDDPELVEVHLVAVRRNEHGLIWRAGESNPAAMARYRSAQLPASNHDEGRSTFPTGADQFEVSVDSTTIIVTDVRSGARWSVDLSPTTDAADAQLADSSG